MLTKLKRKRIIVSTNYYLDIKLSIGKDTVISIEDIYLSKIRTQQAVAQ